MLWLKQSKKFPGSFIAVFLLGFLAACTHDVLLDKAQAGDAGAQRELGVRFASGHQPDYAKAFEWFSKAAAQGNADAQNSLGVMYHQGRGTPQDYRQAFEWYSKAAEQQHVLGMYNTAVMYRTGSGTPQNFSKAIEYFTRAAEQGDADAQVSLGQMYAAGQGVAQDYKKAYMWFDLAASNGQPSRAALDGHDSAVRLRDDVAEKLKLQELTDAQKDAQNLHEKIQMNLHVDNVLHP